MTDPGGSRESSDRVAGHTEVYSYHTTLACRAAALDSCFSTLLQGLEEGAEAVRWLYS